MHFSSEKKHAESLRIKTRYCQILKREHLVLEQEKTLAAAAMAYTDDRGADGEDCCCDFHDALHRGSVRVYLSIPGVHRVTPLSQVLHLRYRGV